MDEAKQRLSGRAKSVVDTALGVQSRSNRLPLETEGSGFQRNSARVRTTHITSLDKHWQSARAHSDADDALSEQEDDGHQSDVHMSSRKTRGKADRVQPTGGASTRTNAPGAGAGKSKASFFDRMKAGRNQGSSEIGIATGRSIPDPMTFPQIARTDPGKRAREATDVRESAGKRAHVSTDRGSTSRSGAVQSSTAGSTSASSSTKESEYVRSKRLDYLQQELCGGDAGEGETVAALNSLTLGDLDVSSWTYIRDPESTTPQAFEKIRASQAARAASAWCRLVVEAKLPPAALAPLPNPTAQTRTTQPSSWSGLGESLFGSLHGDDSGSRTDADASSFRPDTLALGVAWNHNKRVDIEDPLCQTLMSAVQQSAADRLRDVQQRALVSTYEVLTADPRNSLKGGQCPGQRFYELGLQLLDTFEEKRSPDQKRFHDAIFQTLAPHIYKGDFLYKRDELLDKFGREAFNMAAMIMTPRRWGKTTATAMAMAVVLYIGRGINILVFSTGQDMSTTLMNKVKGYFMQLPRAEQRLLTVNDKKFVVSHIDETPGKSKALVLQSGRCNSLLARAATVSGNKGVTADVFVLEEASRIPKQILHEVIAPMLKVSNSVLLALSTHLGEDNYYTKLFDRQGPEMDELFVRIRVELMCAACKERAANPLDCNHLEHLHPPWLLGGNSQRVKLMMEDDEQLYAQEVLGAIFSDKECVYDRKWIKALEARPRRVVERPAQLFALTMMDPAGGGSSRTAIVTIVREPGGHIVIMGGAEGNPNTSVEVELFVKTYMCAWARLPKQFATMQHVIAVENNYGGGPTADMFFLSAKAVLPRVIEYRSKDEQPGVCTTSALKNAAVMSSIWDMFDGRIHFSDTFATITPGLTAQAQFIERMLTQCGQLHKTYTSAGKWGYTGKTPQGDQDDIVIAFLLACVHSTSVAVRHSAMRQAGYNTLM
jgi:hypothetical protein